MKISDSGLALIKSHEGLRMQAYLCPANVWTIGYGHTQGVRQGDEIDEIAATALLQADIAWVEDCINESVEVSLTQGQFDSLCSFVFNLGCKAFQSSTLLKLLNAGNYEGARQQFARWDKAAGKVLPGLTRRRKEEAELFS